MKLPGRDGPRGDECLVFSLACAEPAFEAKGCGRTVRQQTVDGGRQERDGQRTCPKVIIEIAWHLRHGRRGGALKPDKREQLDGRRGERFPFEIVRRETDIAGVRIGPRLASK